MRRFYRKGHAGQRTAKVAATALAYLEKHLGAVGVAHDEVNFAAPSPRGPIIALHQLQALGLQMAQRQVLCLVPRLLGGGLTCFLPFEVIHSPLRDERQL